MYDGCCPIKSNTKCIIIFKSNQDVKNNNTKYTTIPCISKVKSYNSIHIITNNIIIIISEMNKTWEKFKVFKWARNQR